jgi:hypothetical protein
MVALLWFAAFALTVALEAPVVWAILRRVEPSAGRLVALAAFASLATHPVVWFVFPELPPGGWGSTLLSEAWAVATEALFYALALRGLAPARALLASVASNALSFGAGILLATLSVFDAGGAA